MSARYEFAATAAFGLEGVVARELRRLGYEDAKGFQGGATFSGTLLDAFRANLWLRSADRVLLYAARFRAETFEALFEGVRGARWEELLPAHAEVYVTATCARSRLMSVPDVQSVGKKAVVERLKAAYSLNWLPEDGARYHIDIHIHEDEAVVSLDTSGAGLARRGYRTLNAAAPLRETLAAAMLLVSPGRAFRPMYDPLCGSGTLPIEAAMIALDRAPGLLRPFDMEKWDCADKAGMESLRREARERFEAAKARRTVEVFGSDVDERVLRLAAAHRAQAGLNDFIRLEKRDVRTAELPAAGGDIVTNPPYGERLGSEEEARSVAGALRALWQKGGEDWTLTAISSRREFEKDFGCRCTRRRKVYNGRMECGIFSFDARSARKAPERRPLPPPRGPEAKKL